jgi:hypothetical protein
VLWRQRLLSKPQGGMEFYRMLGAYGKGKTFWTDYSFWPNNEIEHGKFNTIIIKLVCLLQRHL